MEITLNVTETFVVKCCGNCGIQFAVPDHFDEENRKKGAEKTWYCPNGHPRVYRKTTADEEREKRVAAEAALLAARTDRDYWQFRARKQEKSKIAMRGQVTRIKNRVGHGVCPCCEREFQNLKRHMNTKHPEFAVSEVPAPAPEEGS
jgi:hypothetical protein